MISTDVESLLLRQLGFRDYAWSLSLPRNILSNLKGPSNLACHP